LGIWKWVFELPVPKALAVLSMNTILYEDRLSPKQEEKFLHALEGNGTQNREFIENLCRVKSRLNVGRQYLPKMTFPTIFDMNGSVPIHGGHNSIRPNGNIGKAAEALQASWQSIPRVTYQFLDDQDLLGYMPWPLVFNRDGTYVMFRCEENVGRVSVLQEPQLKARIVGNPNRVLQKTLEPLKHLYMETARRLPTDVTHAQEQGVAWAQSKLRESVRLSSSDLTSASDLLDIELCLMLVDSVFGFKQIPGYQDHTKYLLQVSRAPWYCKDLDRVVRWKQGSVLGSNPSFGLLTLTNNCMALKAWQLAKGEGKLPEDLDWQDSFRVVGDDIIMLEPMAPYYNVIVEAMGGEINHSKSLVSDRCVEFCGRIVTPQQVYLKKINYCEPSDNSFMSIMSQLGDQAKYFLKPRQRKVYEAFKAVPGVAVDGPWMQDSYGEPLDLRYSWYLSCVQPVLQREEPDQYTEEIDMSLLRALLDVQQQGGDASRLRDFLEPAYDEGYLPSYTNTRFKSGGDPRLTNGKSLVDALEQHLRDGSITPYKVWKEDRLLEDVQPWTPESVNTPRDIRDDIGSLDR
jgi:hypothetical protein